MLVACAAPPKPLSPTPATPPATTTLTQALPFTTPRPPQASQTTSIPEVTAAFPSTIAPLLRVTSTQPITLTAIQMFNTQIGWGWADFPSDDYYSHLLHTADGGHTWRDVSPPTGSGYGYALAMRDVNTAWAHPEDPRTRNVPCFESCPGWPDSISDQVWHTQDGGQHWEPGQPLDLRWGQNYPGMSYASEIKFINSQTGWLLVSVNYEMMHSDYELFKTTDGGAHWQRVADPEGISSCGVVHGVIFLDAQTGWLAAHCLRGDLQHVPYLLYQTHDSGQTWQGQRLPPPTSFTDLFTNLEMGCQTSELQKWTARSFSLAVYCTYIGQGEPPDPWYAYLYTTTDEGQTWQVNPFPPSIASRPENPALLSFPYAADSRTVWALLLTREGEPSTYTLYRTQDDGQSWIAIKTATWVGTFDFINDTEGWVIAYTQLESSLLHTTDGGWTWTQLQPQLVP